MNSQPLVSVVMVNRNNGRFLDKAIESVVGQTWPRWELIVIEDASEDDSWDIVQAWMKWESRIRAVRLRQRVNIPAARNAALARVRGTYVATLDSDDVWLSEHLSKELEFMEAPENSGVGVCGTNVWLINENGRVTGAKRFPQTHEQCIRSLWWRNPFCHSATLMRRGCLMQCGEYDETFEVAQDLELWLRIGRVFTFHNLDEYLVKYRVWPGNVTAQKHRTMVRHTLRARRLAAIQYGYRTGMRERFALTATWLALWLTPRLARKIFEKCVTGQHSRSDGIPDPPEVSEIEASIRIP